MSWRRLQTLAVVVGLFLTVQPHAQVFVETGLAQGARISHGFTDGFSRGEQMMAGGAAAGDLDGDGDMDLVVLRGGQYQVGSSSVFLPPMVLKNDGSGLFTQANSGLSAAHLPIGAIHNGAYLFDLDGDADLDLLLGAIGAPPEIWHNDGQGQFSRVQPNPFAGVIRDTWGISAGLLDGDDRLDLVQSHWSMGLVGLGTNQPGHIWLQGLSGQFLDVTALACCPELQQTADHTFTASLAPIDGMAGTDLLWAGDFGTSRMLRGNELGVFQSIAPIGLPSDENGMGSALGDFDNDGDLDWFVTSVFDPTPPSPEDPDGNWGHSGNRLYRNDANTWTEVSVGAGVRDGGWGWGACARDFDLDGDLDLLNVNGFFGAMATEFHQDPIRLFRNQGDGTFTESATAAGIADTGQGRTVLCTDFDQDGDVDAFVQNSGETMTANPGFSRLFVNQAASGVGLGQTLRLRQSGANRDAVGARIEWLGPGSARQIRVLEAGGNFLGTHPNEAHVGWPTGQAPTRIRVIWPDGAIEWFWPSSAKHVQLARGSGSDLFLDAFE